MYAFCAVLIGLASIPIANVITSAQTQNEFIIFEADSDKIETKYNGNLDASVSSGSSAFKTIKRYDENGSYFSTDFSIEGNGGTSSNAVFVSGIDNFTKGFGWLSDSRVLKRVAKFFTVQFDYRVTSESELPEDAKLNMSAANTSNNNVCEFGSVSAYDVNSWKKATLELSESFSFAWQSGFINISLSSASGGLTGIQTVDIRRVKIFVNEDDRLAFNNSIKQATYTNIENFTKGETIKKDSAGNNDIFSLIVANDAQFYSSTSPDNSNKHINIVDNGGAMVTLSKNRAKCGEKISINIALPLTHGISKIEVKDSKGSLIEVEMGAVNKRYSFAMPEDDVYISIVICEVDEIPLALLWQCDPGTFPYMPYYGGTNSAPINITKIHDTDEGMYVYKFDVTDTQGYITLYGMNSGTYLLEDFYDTAYVTFRVKYNTETTNKTIKIGTKIDGPVKELTVGDGWVEIGAYFKELSSSSIGWDYFEFDVSGLSVGDTLCVGSAFIWSDKPESSYAGLEKIRDISHYQKKETNIKMFEIGDTTAAINPWNSPNGQSVCPIHFDRAWHTVFQNMYAWEIYNQENIPPNAYSLEFYYNGNGTPESANGGMRNYIDTGYIEFFMKTKAEGYTLPLVVLSSNSAVLPIYAKYDSSKAREDGWMCVRIPFTYLSDFGMDIGTIDRIGIRGSEPLPSEVYLSSFRFYTNYADNPDPAPIEEEVPPEERDLPIELDTSIINAVLDKENKILYVPKNTHIWEILSAITFDTNESYVWFYDTIKEEFISDEELLVTDMFDMSIYRRDIFVDSFIVQYLVSETGGNKESTVNEQPIISNEPFDTDVSEDESSNKDKPSDIKIPIKVRKSAKSSDSEEFNITIIIVIAASAIAVLGGAIIGVVYFKKKKGRKNNVKG